MAKERRKQNLQPNLQNYKEFYKKFKWKDAEKEFLFFDSRHKKLNIAYNIENLYKERKNDVALFWQGEQESNEKQINFNELFSESNKFANLLKRLGIKKGDKCFIFLPRIPELYAAFLGILKAGAVATILFPAFGSEGIRERLVKGDCKLIVTNKELLKRIEGIKDKKGLPLKYAVIINGKNANKKFWREIGYNEVRKESDKFDIVKTDINDTAVMVFTSATAGTPVAGIMLRHYAIIQQIKTAEWVLDLKQDDVYWCTADPGWVTGIVYGIIAPLTLGIKSIAYEGRFDADRWYSLIEKFKVSVMYTAPTALRMLMQTDAYKRYNLKCLRHICSVGEYLNPEIARKIKNALGLVVHDTYWQSETGVIVIANLRCLKVKLGSMGKPVPGVSAFIVDNGKHLGNNREGYIALAKGFPSLMTGIYKKNAMYKEYFKGGMYLTGDRGYRDKEGYFFFSGRRDDMIKTSGERVSVLEIESHLLEHRAIAETAVIGKPDPIRGEIIVAFIVLKSGHKPSENLKNEIKMFMKKRLAGHAYPREIYFVPEIPKTRSGKIMRRVCKAILLGQSLGDLSMLVNPKSINAIKKSIE